LKWMDKMMISRNIINFNEKTNGGMLDFLFLLVIIIISNKDAI
jgi:hypothetical protein